MAKARAIAAAVAITTAGVGGASSLAFEASCNGTDCEYKEDSYHDLTTDPRFGAEAAMGRILPEDPNAWESAPLDGQWLNFPATRVFKFHVPLRVTEVVPYVSSNDPGSDDAGAFPNRSQFTVGSGNIAEIAWELPDNTGTSFQVINGSCAQLYLRVVARGTPIVPPPPPADAGPDAEDAGPDVQDAAIDSSDSGPIDAPLDG